MTGTIKPPSTLRRNIAATYVSQFYATITGIVLTPIYLRLMGPESFGLIGFFVMLQGWFALLDLGISPTVSRETARYLAGATQAIHYRRLVRSLTVIFVAMGVAGGAAILVLSGFIATRWLDVQSLPVKEVSFAIAMMAISLAVRWVSGLYRSSITGAERLVWLGGYTIILTTIRYLGVIPVMLLLGATPRVFFVYQVLVAIVELGGLLLKSHKLLPRVNEPIGWSFRPVRSVLGFSLAIAFTSSIWAFVTQTDKLVLSKLLPLSTYAYFVLAVLAAGGITLVTGSIGTALMPRLASLEAKGDREGAVRLYRAATQFACAIGAAAGVTLAVFAPQILHAWTGDPLAVAAATPVLRLYATGYAILVVGAFPYYMLYAQGRIRLHMVGSTVFIAVLLPCLIFGTLRLGMVGAGWAWLLTNAAYVFLWVPYIHRQIQPGLHAKWLGEDIAPILLVCGGFIVAWLALDRALDIKALGKWGGIVVAGVFGGSLLVATLLASRAVRTRFAEVVRLRHGSQT